MEFKVQVINKLDVNLSNLERILRPVLKEMENFKRMDIVLTLGESGSGKSTLLNSLIFGPVSLVLKKSKTPSLKGKITTK